MGIPKLPLLMLIRTQDHPDVRPIIQQVDIPDCEDREGTARGLLQSPIDAPAVLSLNRRPSERCCRAHQLSDREAAGPTATASSQPME